MSKCSTGVDGEDLKALTADSAEVMSGHRTRMLTGEPFLLMGRSLKKWRASWDRDSGESSATGISIRNRGCLSFLSLLVSLRLLRGFSKVVVRHVLACWMAASFEFGGVREQSGDRERVLVLLREVEGNGREEEERVLVCENGDAGFGVVMVFV